MNIIDTQELLKKLRSLAGNRSSVRGEEYFEADAVGPVTEKDGTISAKVHGAHAYQVRLTVTGSNTNLTLAHSCTCPVGRDGDCCKHCVAVGLAWAEQRREAASKAASGHGTTGITVDDIRKWLEAQGAKVLVNMLMEQVTANDRLRQNLTLKIARETAKGVDLSAYRGAIRTACHVKGYLDYGEVYEFSEEISEVVGGLEKLCEEGFAVETVVLCEYALEQLAPVLEQADDSDGYLGAEAERLQELHLEACRMSMPEPVSLAERLLNFELSWDDNDIFYNVADTYRDVLGPQGLAAYRRLVEQEWQTLPAKTTGSGDSAGDYRRRRITRIMESLAKSEGNVDELIAIKQRDLSSSWNYLDIAKILQEAGRHGEALSWAEKGLMTFKDRPDNRLRDFCAEEYHRLGRHDDACRAYWIQFAEQPEPGYYKKLLEYATSIDRCAGVREEALRYLRADIDKIKKTSRNSPWFRPDHSRLVEIFLWENRGEDAWNEAKSGGCRDPLWLELAKMREKEHPADAVPVYQRLVEPIIGRMKNDAYEEAIRMIRHIRTLMHGMGQQAGFAAYLAQVRLRHKPKRNLMKLLDNI